MSLMMRASLLALTLLMASIVRGDSRLHVHPFASTPGSAIDLHFVAPCAGGDYHVSLYDRDLIVSRIGRCTGTLTPTEMIVRLGMWILPGKRHVKVRFDNGPIIAETDFLVLDLGSEDLSLRPKIVPTSGGVRMRLDGLVCPTEDCSGFKIFLNGTRVTDFARGSDGAIWFTAPPHAEGYGGLIVTGGVQLLYSNKIYYSGGFDRALYERVLFPVLTHTHGFGGSEWVSEGVIANPSPWFVDQELGPGAVLRIGEGHPRGFVYLAPRTEADSLAFALHIRDVSREDATLGTRVPVVREKDMVHGGDITLLDVPRDPRYRVKVRIYAFDPMIDAQGLVRTSDGTSTVALTRSCADCADEPYYAELDVRSGAPGERTDITIVPPRGSLAWAFATVTNNQTQQVTVVTP